MKGDAWKRLERKEGVGPEHAYTLEGK